MFFINSCIGGARFCPHVFRQSLVTMVAASKSSVFICRYIIYRQIDYGESVGRIHMFVNEKLLQNTDGLSSCYEI